MNGLQLGHCGLFPPIMRHGTSLKFYVKGWHLACGQQRFGLVEPCVLDAVEIFTRRFGPRPCVYGSTVPVLRGRTSACLKAVCV